MAHRTEHRGEPGKGLSIRKVAELAGVSVATVSRVINSPEVVAEPTRSRVQAVITQMGYTPNPFAQVLTTGESRVIGIALPWFHGEFITSILQGADAQATKLGYQLIMTSFFRPADGSRRDRVLGNGFVDGVIAMIDNDADPLVNDLAGTKLPAVVLDTDLSSRGVDSVILDNASGTKAAVEHLLSASKPGDCYFVGGPRANFDSALRAASFGDCIKNAGAQLRDEQVCFGDYSMEWGRDWAERAHREGHLKGAAVLAGNDDIAFGIIRRAAELGVKCPGDFRIVGFDDTKASNLFTPRLSSVTLPMEELGSAAVRMLVARIENREAPVVCEKYPTRLIVRESSRP
ncbi:MAG: LacI family DNA-binding transcriptional regulator [Phycisphaerales bacterium]